MPRRAGPPSMAGRWSRLPDRDTDPTRRAHAVADQLLDRYGIVTRGVVTAEGIPGGFAGVYRVLRAFEDAGRARRGYFVESLGAAQFALVGAVERVRAAARAAESGADPAAPVGSWPAPPSRWTAGPPDGPAAIVLAATDPANPYGAALGWPARRPVPGTETTGGHRPGRKAGALVVLVGGELVLYVERGGRTLLSWSDEPESLRPAVDALSLAVRDGWLGRLDVRTADGQAVLTSELGVALEGAGFHPTPSGLRLRA
jgi:ATP-dependent Lhr-like helicase